MKSVNIAHALHSLAPGSSWKYNDEDYSTIEWFSDDITMPSELDVLAEIERLQKQHELEQEAIAKVASDKEVVRQSAINKLSKFGLTIDEINAVIGID